MNNFFPSSHRGRYFFFAFVFISLSSHNAGNCRAVFPTEHSCVFAKKQLGNHDENGKSGGQEFTFKIDINSFKAKLSSVLNEKEYLKNSQKTNVVFPLPSGEKVSYEVAEAPIMEVSGEQLYGYKSYSAFHSKTGEMTGRFSVSKNGVNGIFEEKGRLFSIKSVDNNTHKSVFEKHLNLPDGCELSDEFRRENSSSNFQQKRNDFSYGHYLRVFRIAITNRGELSDRAVQLGQHLPTVLADYINQVNFLFEKELSIRFQVVTPILTYTDKNTDPFTNANTFNLIQEARSAIDQLYAGKNYHLGHLFGYFGGGRAYLNSVCGINKSGAVTGVDLPLSSPFLRLLAHELAHQFGAGHSFNSDGPFCGQNIFPGSAYEIGSGSTLMSYAGSCVGENVETVRSKFFNSGALEEINSFAESKIVEGCGSSIWLGNNPPVVNVPSGKTIPARTPFFLEGTASDSDGNSLIYSWEQHDLGPVGLLGEEAAIRPTVPLFRVFDPAPLPKRMFPNIEAVLNNDNHASYEILPKVTRKMNFFLTARDQRGGVGCSEVELDVHDTGKSFKLLSHNTPQTIPAGTSATLRWDVAGTDISPISTSDVDILFSSDGGLTFPISLKRNTANDGEALINFPSQATEKGRIMIRAVGNFFFDINNADLRLTNSPPPPPANALEMTFIATPSTYRQWSHIVFSVEVKNNAATPVNNLKISIPTVPGKLVYSNSATGFGSYNSFFEQWEIPRISAGGTATLALTFFTLVKNETFEVKATQVGGDLEKTIVLRPFNTSNLQPDLLLQVEDSPDLAMPGDLLSANLILENRGSDAARGNFMIGIYLSADQNFDPTDIQIGTIATGNTPVGSLPTTAGFIVPANQTPGDYYLIYFVDNQNVIQELNEGNNRVSQPIKIEGVIPPPSCDISTVTSQKRCLDSGTPDNPDDDQFSFNIQFMKSDNGTGNFRAQIGDIYREGFYGGTYIFGPYSISEGNVSGHVEDFFSPACFSDFLITPTATCSDEGAVDYCESKSNFPWHEWIAGVTFAGRQNNSGKNPYSDFTDSPIMVSKGQTVVLKLTAGFSWFTADEYFRVWMDFNQDGQFSNDEMVFQKTLLNPGDGTPAASVSGTAFIPFSARTGMTRMRVSMKKGSPPNACGDIDFGEIEDYMILVGGN